MTSYCMILDHLPRELDALGRAADVHQALVGGGLVGGGLLAGAEDCTPESETSEIAVDVQWRVATEAHFSVVCSKGLPLVQWIVAGIVQWISVAPLRGGRAGTVD